MANDTLTLALNGEVSLRSFVEAVRGLHDLVSALTSELSESRVTWIVEALESGSAMATIRGSHHSAEEAIAVAKVVNGYDRIGRSLERGEPLGYSEKVEKSARRILRVIKGGVESVRFETADTDFTFFQPSNQIAKTIVGASVVAQKESRPSFAAIEGRIQSLSNRGTLRFTLYDSLDDRAISCYLRQDNEDLIREAWGRRAIIEGMARRDSTNGRATTIREISNITIIPEAVPDGYEKAFGVVPIGRDDISPEEAIRRIRDAW